MVGPLSSMAGLGILRTQMSESHMAAAALGPGLEGNHLLPPIATPEKRLLSSRGSQAHYAKPQASAKIPCDSKADPPPQLPASRTMLWPVSTGPGLCTGTTSPTVHSSAQPFCRLSGSGWSSDFGDETRRLSQERKEGCIYMAQVSEWWFRILLT